ncbi:MAG: MBOAT family protein [Candidatus Omnitrophica bacterium]|nr:MBOAT family protein [Candidatus Omnitrophota bacterium]
MKLFSLEYGLFLLSVFYIFYLLPHRHQWKLLLAASLGFYMITVPLYVVVPFTICMVSYVAGLLIENTGRNEWKKAIFIMSLMVNIGILIFFKYVDFLTKSFFMALGALQSHFFQGSAFIAAPSPFNILVPLGISYITFQGIGYTIEIYRGNHRAEKNMGLFFTYLMFFPKIYSGPIERAHHFLPQLHERKTLDYELVSDGLKLIVWGLFKKLIIAERLSKVIDIVFQNPDHYAGIPLIFASVIFLVQLYADFSGYTDIAIGSANVLGFKLTANFNFPLIARSTTELWRRWHISLSTWFFEYVYNPIAIAKREWNQWAVIYASLVTFLILGLWHGASWKFVVFGLLQGVVLSAEFLTKKFRKIISSKLPEVVNNCIGVMFTVLFFSFSLLFFKAGNFSDAAMMARHYFIFTGDESRIYSLFQAFKLSGVLKLTFLAGLLLAVEYLDRNFDLKKVISRQAVVLRWLIYYMVIFAILTFGKFQQEQFIYFKF